MTVSASSHFTAPSHSAASSPSSSPCKSNGYTQSSSAEGITSFLNHPILPDAECMLSTLGFMVQFVWMRQKGHDRQEDVRGRFRATKELIARAGKIPPEKQKDILHKLDGLEALFEEVEQLQFTGHEELSNSKKKELGEQIQQLHEELSPSNPPSISSPEPDPLNLNSTSSLGADSQPCWQESEEVRHVRALLAQLFLLAVLTKSLHTCLHLFEEPKTSDSVTPEVPSQPDSSQAAASVCATENAAAATESAEEQNGEATRKSQLTQLLQTEVLPTASGESSRKPTSINGHVSSSSSQTSARRKRGVAPPVKRSFSTPNLPVRAAADIKGKAAIRSQGRSLLNLFDPDSSESSEVDIDTGISSSDENIFGIEIGSPADSAFFGSPELPPQAKNSGNSQNKGKGKEKVVELAPLSQDTTLSTPNTLPVNNSVDVELSVQLLTGQISVLQSTVEELQKDRNALRSLLLRQKRSPTPAKGSRTRVIPQSKVQKKKVKANEQKSLAQQENLTKPDASLKIINRELYSHAPQRSSASSSSNAIVVSGNGRQSEIGRHIYESRQDNQWIHVGRSNVPNIPFFNGMGIHIPVQGIKTLPVAPLHSTVNPVTTNVSATTSSRVFLGALQRRQVGRGRSSEEAFQSNNPSEPSTPFHYAVLTGLYLGVEQIIGLLKRVKALEIWRVAEQKEINGLKHQIEQLESAQQQALIDRQATLDAVEKRQEELTRTVAEALRTQKLELAAQQQAMQEAFEKRQEELTRTAAEALRTQQLKSAAQQQAMQEAFAKEKEELRADAEVLQAQQLESVQQQALIEQQAMQEAFAKEKEKLRAEAEALRTQLLESVQQQALTDRQAMQESFAKEQEELSTAAEALRTQLLESVQQQALSDRQAMLEAYEEKQEELISTIAKALQTMQAQVDECTQNGVLSNAAVDLEGANKSSRDVNRKVAELDENRRRIAESIDALNAQLLEGEAKLEKAASTSTELLQKKQVLAECISSVENLNDQVQALTKDLASGEAALDSRQPELHEKLKTAKKYISQLEEVLNQFRVTLSAFEVTDKQAAIAVKRAQSQRSVVGKERGKILRAVNLVKQDKGQLRQERLDAEQELADGTGVINAMRKVTEELPKLKKNLLAARNSSKKASNQERELLSLIDALETVITTANIAFINTAGISEQIEIRKDKLDGQLLQLSKLETLAQELMRISDAVEAQVKLVKQNAERVKAEKKRYQDEFLKEMGISNVVGIAQGFEEKIATEGVRQRVEIEAVVQHQVQKLLANAQKTDLRRFNLRLQELDKQEKNLMILQEEVRGELLKCKQKVKEYSEADEAKVKIAQAEIEIAQLKQTVKLLEITVKRIGEAHSSSLLEEETAFTECKNKVIQLCKSFSSGQEEDIDRSSLERVESAYKLEPENIEIVGNEIINSLDEAIRGRLRTKIAKLSEVYYAVTILDFLEAYTSISEEQASTISDEAKMAELKKKLANAEYMIAVEKFMDDPNFEERMEHMKGKSRELAEFMSPTNLINFKTADSETTF